MDDSTRIRLLDFLHDSAASPDPEAALTSLTSLACELTASESAQILNSDESLSAGGASQVAPILFRGELLGALQISRPGGEYSEEEIETLETLAALAAFHLRELQLQAASRNERAELDRLKADFIAITSHELRTPLGLILGHATFMRELTDENHEHIDMIVRYATRLKEIVESLSTVDNYTNGMARLRQNQILIHTLLSETIALYEEQANARGVTIQLAMAEPDLTVKGEAGKLGIALGNLIKNAIAFSERGGHIIVSAESDAGAVNVSVRDEGIGIPVADLPRIFERFYQVESHLTRKHGGMGLGLAVAKSMIELHGGTISVTSEEGKGSTFSFRLPTHHS